MWQYLVSDRELPGVAFYADLEAKVTYSKGAVPWNKGIKTGLVPRTAFKPGQIPLNKGLTKGEMLKMGIKSGGWPTGTSRSPDTCSKIGEANKGKPAWNKGLTKKTAEAMGKCLMGGRHTGGIPWNKGVKGCWNDESLKRIVDASKGRKPSPETLKKRSFKLKGRTLSVETKGKIGKANKISMKQNWQDPEYRTKQRHLLLKGMKRRPTKPEAELMGILSAEYPNEWAYSGDGQIGVVLAGLVPDFVNINGKKLLIELFGEYWHTQGAKYWHQTELGRVRAYKSVGFDCLIIWQEELKDKKTLNQKLEAFMGTGR